MKFTYQEKEYSVADPTTWTTLEWIKVEQYSGLRPKELMREFAGFEPVGIHATVWVSLQRAGEDIAWNDLDLPWMETFQSFRGESVSEPPDPSPASTARRKAASRTRSARTASQSQKN